MTRSLGWTLFFSMMSAVALVLCLVWLLEVPGASIGLRLGRAAGLATVVTIALSWALSAWFARPLEAMKSTANALADGELAVRVRSRRSDAVGELGRAIDRMADQLAERFDRVEAEKERLRTIVDAMIEAVLVTDPAGRIVLWNEAFVRLVGRDPEGATILEALRNPELGDAVRDATAAQLRTETSFEWSTPSGSRSLRAQIAPLPRRAGVVTVLHDVTDLKRADAVRRDFVANASHELRTPLTSIRGFAETLLDGAIEDPVIARRFARNIADNAVRLQRLVEDLLELSRAESPDVDFELEPVSALEVAERVVRSLEDRARAKSTSLRVDASADESWCLAEPKALDHVLTNLVENAIKYTPDGSHVVVRVTPEEDRMRIAVEDDGPGIAPQHLPRIFERFYRIDSGRARDQGGTGLGLSIVKHMSSRMKGDVRVDSRLGRGTTFTVRLGRPRISLSDWPDEE